MAKLLDALLAVSLIGCTLAPRYERPALPVPDRFPGGGGSLAAADQGWRTMFGDPRLQALIALALANNRDLRVAALNVEVARAQYRIQRAGLFPTLDARAAWSRFGGSGPFAGSPSSPPSSSSSPTAASSGSLFPPSIYALG